MTQLRIDGEPPSSLLLFTSNLIFIPTIIAGLLGRWGDVYIITTQAVCAIWFHYSHTIVSFYADQVSMYLLAIHTLLLAISHPVLPFLYVLGFGYMLVVYSYGKRNRCFCFDPDTSVAEVYHASIHILGIIIYSVSMAFFLPLEARGIFGFPVLISLNLLF